jgi:polysaccharide biosynthesis transport protein
MNSSPNQNEVSQHAIDYWQVIKNRYGVILLTLLLVFMTVSVITYVMPKEYESYATIEVKPRERTIDPLAGMMARTSGPTMTPQFFGTEFEKIKSRNSLNKVIDSLNLVNKWGIERETILIILKRIVNTQNKRGTDLITISVRHTSKDDARDIAAEVAHSYKNYRTELEGNSIDIAINELRKAVREQEDKVEERRKVLTTISRSKNVIYHGDREMNRGGLDEDMEKSFALNQFSLIESEKMQLESQIQSLEKYDNTALLTYAQGLDLPDNIIKNLYPEYLALSRSIEGMKASGLGDLHPTIVSNKRILEQMEGDLDDGVENLRLRLHGQLETAKQRLMAAKDKKDVESKEAIDRSIDITDYVDAKRNFETDLSLLENMKLKLITEEISGDLPQETIILHDEPVIANDPVSPMVRMNLILGAVAGLVFGLAIAFFLEYLDTSVKTLEDVERYLQVPVLAVIPRDVGVLYKQNGISPDAEAYRILRTNIEFNRKNPEDNAITVVSGGAGEGKSTTLVNLAYICAQGGYTTLMIDADLRRPRLHTFFEINNSVGLTNFLTTELMLEDVILQTPVDNLYFMPSGILPADAAGILNSRRMSELIQDVKQRFDLILVDSPPILGVSDASVLASEVDLTMIVVQHRKLPRNMLMRVKQAVENVGGHVIGVVLNNVDVRSDSQYQYYTSYYTYYAPAESQIGPSVGGNSKNSQPLASASADTKENDLY